MAHSVELSMTLGVSMSLWPSGAVVNVSDAAELVTLLVRGKLDRYPTMTWRGVANIDWPIDCSLARKLIKTQCDGDRGKLTEAMMASAEAELIQDARRLRLDSGDGSRKLTDLELLARLQHHGAATRLLDVSSNALTATWFAVEDLTQDAEDGALYGIDMTDSVLPDNRHDLSISEVLAGDWIWLWRPPPVDDRIRVQQGSFIFSAVPGPGSAADRSKTSLALEITKHKASRLFVDTPGKGKYAKSPVIIFKIPSAVKSELRNFLAGRLGYTIELMFPDLPGFARARKA
ncbi:FRG domain-containing protein [Actinoplanes sp. CA-252034]|uniref:FRG domain-containing protein n=1 Tax=Actinoplanes sp. CA-252034 TaxID=3239906 RepID=UPI003D96548D